MLKTSADSTTTPESIPLALGRVASGVYVLTIGAGDSATGMLASWVMQAGFDPPMVTVALGAGRHVAERLGAGEPFVLNVIGAEQSIFLKHFGKGFAPGAAAFEGVAAGPGANGAPVLADAIAALECLPTGESFASEDHRVFLARVTAGALRSDDAPMTHVRKRGDRY
ncbi:MAG: flavin reductase family protein [Lacipirellulaceae bacterium]